MPRGRHRHSPPLHKLLPPLAVVLIAVAGAAAAWGSEDPLVLRGLAAVAAVSAVVGAAFMRVWDREAGRRVADLLRARDSDQWKTDERVAELEADVEEAREIRAKLDSRLRAKRVELARLRGEHAALLRRYATAETERASALEGRRRLAIEAAVEPKALAAPLTLSPSAFLMAKHALDTLEQSRAVQAEEAAAETAPEPAAPADGEAPRAEATGHPDGEAAAPAEARPAPLPARRGSRPSAIEPYAHRARPRQRPGGGFDFFGTQGSPHPQQAHAHPHALEDEQAGPDEDGTDAPPPAIETADALTEPAAPAIGTASAPEHAAGQDAPGQDASDDAPSAHEEPADEAESDEGASDGTAAVGDEGASDGTAAVGDDSSDDDEQDARHGGQVIDLTEHDDTEPLEVRGLRSALGS